MKIFLIGLLSFMGLFAENINDSVLTSFPDEEDNCKDCRVQLPLQKNIEKRTFSPMHISVNSCSNKIIKLTEEIKVLTEKFLRYKEERKREIDALHITLNTYENREISSSDSQNYNNDTFEEKSFSENIENIPSSIKQFAWVEIVVEDNLDIYELALKYYGAYEEFHFIYRANKNVLGNSMILHQGMVLHLPINENFREQPLIINTK